MPTLAEVIERFEVPGSVFKKMEHDWVRCFSCGHRCKIGPGKDGICRVRSNRNGVLYVPHGYAAGIQLDPIEKKPFFHVLPGAQALSFGMLGCDYHCAYCQNWLTSQALRDPEAGTQPTSVSAEEIVRLAVKSGAQIVTSTYNEPLITSEWAVEIFTLALQHGLLCSFVSNGNGTPEVLEYLRPYLRMYKVDLKSFRQKNYQQLGGKLSDVLETIRTLHRFGIWVEVVTLTVPGFNDSDEELREIARFLVSVSPDIPWHVTAFHQDYRMTDPPPTPVRTLVRAAEIGKAEGLRYVYAGNIPGRVAEFENTSCPHCGSLLVERSGYRIIRNVLKNGTCPACSSPIPGIWN